jgi:hypothetical protein
VTVRSFKSARCGWSMSACTRHPRRPARAQSGDLEVSPEIAMRTLRIASDWYRRTCPLTKEKLSDAA